MSNDYKKKEPTKTEKVLYELFMQQQGMERSLVTNSALLVSLAMLMNIEPEKLAEALSDNEKIKAYSDRINKKIDELDSAKGAKSEPAAKSETPEDHTGHNHE